MNSAGSNFENESLTEVYLGKTIEKVEWEVLGLEGSSKEICCKGDQ